MEKQPLCGDAALPVAVNDNTLIYVHPLCCAGLGSFFPISPGKLSPFRPFVAKFNCLYLAFFCEHHSRSSTCVSYPFTLSRCLTPAHFDSLPLAPTVSLAPTLPIAPLLSLSHSVTYSLTLSHALPFHLSSSPTSFERLRAMLMVSLALYRPLQRRVRSLRAGAANSTSSGVSPATCSPTTTR